MSIITIVRLGIWQDINKSLYFLTFLNSLNSWQISRSAENGTDDRDAEPSNQMRVVQTLQPPSPTINFDLRRKVGLHLFIY
jgi:hypothetical protein